jgi:hypothetical protein
MDAEDERARHLAVIEFTGPDEATVVGCARMRVGVLTDATRERLARSDPRVGSADDFQVSMSRFVVRHHDAQTNRWAHAWLMSEVLRAATQHRRPFAYATVSTDVADALTKVGIVLERIQRPQSPRRDRGPTVLVRVNALASQQRVGLDPRIPKLPVATWTESRS